MVLGPEFVEAVERGDVDWVADWLQSLDSPEDINDVNAEGKTVLSMCTHEYGGAQDALAILKLILTKGGADVNLGDNDGWTPLHAACNTSLEFSRVAIPLLLAAGANPNAKATYRCGFSATPLSTSIEYFQCCGFGSGDARDVDAEETLKGLECVRLLLRAGASPHDCWNGASAENYIRHIEDGTIPAIEDAEDGDWGNTPDLSENAHFLECKALIKQARCEPRKTVLTLRALAIKGRAKTADPVLKFLVDMPDGVAGNVLSFWPPATRYIAVRGPGTGQIPFRPYRDVDVVKAPACRICGRSDRASGCPGCFGAGPVFDKRTENVHYAISLTPAYGGKSFEELRLEDYELGRDAGKWWIGGALQINNDRDMATALEAFQLGLPSDSDEETIPGIRSIEARLRVNNVGALVAMDVV